ncbi:MAG: amidase [Chloroflexota bacterium]|nr:amidase [Chloroflexota bacterium]
MTESRALIDLSISEAAAAIRRGETSSVALTQATLARIKETEATLQAYAAVPAELALAAAERADGELAAGHDRGPLHGIPIAVKDNCYSKGIRTEVGSKVYAGFVPDYDATVVEKLYAAGAVVIGKTVCHEFSCGGSDPPTRSPWDLSRFPGGSSIGSGVALAARSAFGAIGTDTGGSVRIPASINNLVGMKATYGRVSAYGVVPLAWSLDHVGPMTRAVLDNALMLRAIAGHDPKDANSARAAVPDFAAGIDGGLSGARIGIDRGYFFYPGVVDSVRAAAEGVIEALAALGADIIEVNLPELALTRETLSTIRMVESASYHRRQIQEKGHLYSPGTRATLEIGQVVLATAYVAALRVRERFRAAMKALFKRENLDALISPTIPVPAPLRADVWQPRDDMEDGETPTDGFVHHVYPANLSGQPAISAPAGFSPDGLPIGYSLIGRPFDEATLYRIAYAYERTQNWHERQPPQVYPTP